MNNEPSAMNPLPMNTPPTSYAATIDYLYSQLPLFTRVGASAYKANLDNTIELCSRLDNPQHKFKSVHVAGTNGKGSTSHMLAAILQTAGYKTGLYTSPHLKDFRERIRINGQMISEEKVIAFVARHKKDFDEINPSFFEMTVGLAFDIFAKEKVDIAIIEVGLGGRLDSTNIITPLFSIITNIGWDHMNILGDTLQLIAGEKAGIIKPGIPVIIGENQPEIAPVFIAKAKQEGSPISFASDLLDAEVGSQKLEVGSQKLEVGSQKLEVGSQKLEVGSQKLEVGSQKSEDGSQKLGDGGLESGDGMQKPGNLAAELPKLFVQEFVEIKVARKTSYNPQPQISNPRLRTSDFGPPPSEILLDLTGSYQLKNVKTVLCAVDELRKQGFNITDEAVVIALSQVKTLTGLHGRWEVLNRDPLTIADTGHNPEGIQEVIANIASVAYHQLHFVLGAVNDKDISKMLNVLPADAVYYFCRPDIPRGLEAENLKQKAEGFGLHGETYPSVKAALAAAQQNAGKRDLVFVGGSTFVVAEAV